MTRKDYIFSIAIKLAYGRGITTHTPEEVEEARNLLHRAGILESTSECTGEIKEVRTSSTSQA